MDSNAVRMMVVTGFVLLFIAMFTTLIMTLAMGALTLMSVFQDPSYPNATNPAEKTAPTVKENSMKRPLYEFLGEVYFYAKMYRNALFIVRYSLPHANRPMWCKDLAQAKMQLECALAAYRHQLNKIALNK